MKFSGKTCLMIILKVTKKQNPLSRKYSLGKTTGVGVKLKIGSHIQHNQN